MHTFLNSPWQLGALQLPHRLIQGPLAGYSCAPFRVLYHHFQAPAYCVSEMCSAIDVLSKHGKNSRYLYKDPKEHYLAYQLSGTEPNVLADAALLLQEHGADLIDINCGCPKTKIRKKGAGSALLEDPKRLVAIIQAVRQAINIPLTIKIRIQNSPADLILAQQIEEAGADALIVHGRRWQEDYDIACNFHQIGQIKRHLQIPVIANGDLHSVASLEYAYSATGCDAFMIARAGSGKPWLYQHLLAKKPAVISMQQKKDLFLEHIEGLATLEEAHQAILQSKSLIRYYFGDLLHQEQLQTYYTLSSLQQIKDFIAVSISNALT